jgi:hypothetical protein
MVKIHDELYVNAKAVSHVEPVTHGSPSPKALKIWFIGGSFVYVPAAVVDGMEGHNPDFVLGDALRAVASMLGRAGA